jgi:hypothetical protein
MLSNAPLRWQRTGGPLRSSHAPPCCKHCTALGPRCHARCPSNCPEVILTGPLPPPFAVQQIGARLEAVEQLVSTLLPLATFCSEHHSEAPWREAAAGAQGQLTRFLQGAHQYAALQARLSLWEQLSASDAAPEDASEVSSA